MLFNSIDFAIFLPIVFCLYWFVFQRNLKLQNILITAASYVFYGWWDWRFLSLIFFSTVVDFSVGLALANQNKASTRRLLLWLSILTNLGFLGFFKYYNFFLENFVQAFSLFGLSLNPGTLKIILPVGISFYTFQTLSYTIDIYKRKLEPTKNFVAFAAFVSFFPQLVAGPIERATNLLPQFYDKRSFNYDTATEGMRQILWGLFKKIVIADQCGFWANIIFDSHTDYSGSTLCIGAILFAFQIYGDFSGYSDIAIGTAKLFGFQLMQNFAYPYFSRDIAEFWRRWHISLSTWFRDYVYVPLGGSRCGTVYIIRNIFIIFVVSGFWHGANWTFIIWGALNALYFIPLLLSKKNRTHLDVVAAARFFPTLKEVLMMTGTFGITTFAWIFFRAENMQHALSYLNIIFSATLFTRPEILPRMTFVLIFVMLSLEWVKRDSSFPLNRLPLKQQILRWLIYIIFTLVIIAYIQPEKTQFIYFQF